MVRVGIRELKRNVIALIRRAVRGEPVDVADRGRPVTRAVPAGTRDALDQMVDEGRATPLRGDILDIEPMTPLPGRPLLSEILEEMRAHER